MIVIVATVKAAAAAVVKKRIAGFRPWDLAILFASVLVTLGSFFLVYRSGNQDLHVVIEGPDQSWLYPLSAEETIHVPGKLGDTVVVIHNGAAHVESSPCRDKLCIAVGQISQVGQWTACLPNQVFVRIEGAALKDSLDGSTY